MLWDQFHSIRYPPAYFPRDDLQVCVCVCVCVCGVPGRAACVCPLQPPRPQPGRPPAHACRRLARVAAPHAPRRAASAPPRRCATTSWTGTATTPTPIFTTCTTRCGEGVHRAGSWAGPWADHGTCPPGRPPAGRLARPPAAPCCPSACPAPPRAPAPAPRSDHGFFLEVLASPLTCFDAAQYGAVMIVDSEDEFYRAEVAKLAADVEKQGLGALAGLGRQEGQEGGGGAAVGAGAAWTGWVALWRCVAPTGTRCWPDQAVCAAAPAVPQACWCLRTGTTRNPSRSCASLMTTPGPGGTLPPAAQTCPPSTTCSPPLAPPLSRVRAWPHAACCTALGCVHCCNLQPRRSRRHAPPPPPPPPPACRCAGGGCGCGGRGVVPHGVGRATQGAAGRRLGLPVQGQLQDRRPG